MPEMIHGCRTTFHAYPDIYDPGHSVFDPKNGRGVFTFLFPNQGTYRHIFGTYQLALTQGFQ